MRYFFLFFLMSFVAGAQTLTVNPQQLNFGTVSEVQPDSLLLTISNPLQKDVLVTNLKFYGFYGSNPFSCSENSFLIAAGGSHDVYIKFAPDHNIYHNSELVIENNSLRGAVSVDLLAQGTYSNPYYAPTENLKEESLKVALNTLLAQNYNSLGYSLARDSMFMHLDNKKNNGQGAATNTIECIYTGRNAVGYTSRADCQTNDNFNTEHTFPQGLFSSNEPMLSDLHHLFPTDETANNTRGSYPFGTVVTVSWQNGGSRFDNNLNLFEPRDLQKGATARAMLYFVTRYQNYGNFLNSQQSVLKQWNKSFLPSVAERNRNNRIFQYQNNRNPFVDYPQFADRITSFISMSTEAPVFAFDLFNNSIQFDSAAVNDTVIYNLVIVNSGNQNIQLSNFVLSNASIVSFPSGTGTISISPGEAFSSPVYIHPVSAGAISESISMQTNVATSPNISIPVTGNAFVTSLDEFAGNEFKVYPNPVRNRLHFSKVIDGLITITDISGKTVEQVTGRSVSIDLSGLDDGFYLVTVTDSDGHSVYRKIFCEN